MGTTQPISYFSVRIQTLCYSVPKSDPFLIFLSSWNHSINWNINTYLHYLTKNTAFWLLWYPTLHTYKILKINPNFLSQWLTEVSQVPMLVVLFSVLRRLWTPKWNVTKKSATRKNNKTQKHPLEPRVLRALGTDSDGGQYQWAYSDLRNEGEKVSNKPDKNW